jgi:hypothetical protein
VAFGHGWNTQCTHPSNRRDVLIGMLQHPHTLFLLHFLRFLFFDFFPFSVPFGGRGGKRNGRVINKNQFSCCSEYFYLKCRKNIWCVAGYWRKERCEEVEMKERCKGSRDWNRKIARKRRRFGGKWFCRFMDPLLLLLLSKVLTVLKCTNWFIWGCLLGREKDAGHAVVQLVETLRYKPEGRGFDSRWCLNIIDILLRLSL